MWLAWESAAATMSRSVLALEKIKHRIPSGPAALAVDTKQGLE